MFRVPLNVGALKIHTVGALSVINGSGTKCAYVAVVEERVKRINRQRKWALRIFEKESFESELRNRWLYAFFPILEKHAHCLRLRM